MKFDNPSNSQFFKTYKETENWLNEMNIKDYNINKDTLIVDVSGQIWLTNKYLQHIPVKFGKVNGVFNVSYNQNLESLIGCPNSITFMSCQSTRIKSFNGLGSVKSMASYSIKSLETFEGLPNELDFFNISNSCYKVNSLDHFPKIIKEHLFIGQDFKWSNSLYRHMQMCGEITLNGNIEKYNDILKLIYVNGIKYISAHSHTGRKITGILNAEIQRQPDPRKRNLLKVAQELSNAGFHHLTVM